MELGELVPSSAQRRGGADGLRHPGALHPSQSVRVRKLVGRPIPPVALESGDRQTLSLQRLLEESQLAVLYFYPADENSPLRDDMAFHWGFRDRLDDFLARRCRPIGISTEPTFDQADRIRVQKLQHPLLSDPRRLLARELSLPTYRDGNGIFYHRLTLVVFKVVIVRAHIPVNGGRCGAAEVLDWLEAQPDIIP
jgi:peroxiredoxin